jgi:hypothetical protein
MKGTNTKGFKGGRQQRTCTAAIVADVLAVAAVSGAPPVDAGIATSFKPCAMPVELSM